MKKNNVIKNIIKLSLLLLVIWGSISSIQAAPYNSFSIKPSIPDNQINKKVSYFDLLLNEKHQQEISITINNDGADTMVASTNVNNAVTSDNGTINYLSANVKDESQKISVNEVVVVNQPKVEIAPYSSATVTMSINLGDNNFTGNILGGIVVKASSDKISNDKNEQLSIDNEIAYVIGLKLSMNPDVIVKPDLKLIETKGILHDHKTGVGALILNDEPTIMKEVKIVGEVYEKNSNKVISSVDLPNAEIAPNTRFNVIYDWQNKALKDGQYRIKMSAYYQDQEWHWDEEFSIKDEAKTINKEAFEIEKESNNTIIIILISIILLLLLALLVFIILILKKRKKENK